MDVFFWIGLIVSIIIVLIVVPLSVLMWMELENWFLTGETRSAAKRRLSQWGKDDADDDFDIEAKNVGVTLAWSETKWKQRAYTDAYDARMAELVSTRG